MEITNSFTVDEPIETAWELLTDIPFIAPCLPGAKLTDETDGVYSGGIKIKVGPVTAEYKGSAEFVEKDADAYRAVISGKGRDTRGAGNAHALITAQMVPIGSATQVDIVTDLKISGKVAQFGRGVMQDVSTKLLGQFAQCLEAKIAESKGASPTLAADPGVPTSSTGTTATGIEVAATNGAPAPVKDAVTVSPAADSAPASTTAPVAPTSAPGAAGPAHAAPSTSNEDDVLDLGDIGVGSALAKRAAPALGGLLFLLILRRLFGGSRSRE